MATAKAILDEAQIYLHDDGTLWSRTELLGYLNHGYTRLLTDTEAIRRLAAYEIPARIFWSLTHEWERQSVSGRSREWSLGVEVKAGYRATYRWEGEQLIGATPADSVVNCTQFWERLYAGGDVEHNDRYPYPENQIGTCRIVYNGIRLHPSSAGELDNYTPNWPQTSGGPFWYLSGLGSMGEFEIWPQVMEYTQTVELRGLLGTIRKAGNYTTTTGGTGSTISGSSIVTRGLYALGAWGKRLITRGLLGTATTTTITPTDTTYPTGGYGVPRRLDGTVQHVCENMEQPGGPVVGVPRRWSGSDGSLLLDYAIGSPTLTEDDSPSLLPTPFGKYLRYYVLARAMGREGEGANHKLAAHYDQRFQQGLALLRKISFMATTARTYQNAAPMAISLRPLRPRLPSTYPRIR